MIIYLVVGFALGVISLVLSGEPYWYHRLVRARKHHQKELLEARQNTLDEIESISEDRGLSYRESSLVVQQLCAKCRRSCIHCAKETKKEMR